MTDIKFYCVTNKEIDFLNSEILNSEFFKFCWVGKGEAPKNYLTCNTGNNIYNKEKFNSELTFHYWYWKNLLKLEDKNQWIGFCQKRRFWVNTQDTSKINKLNLNQYMIKLVENDWKDYDAIICNPISVHSPKKIKIFKRGWKNFLQNPSILFNKKKQNLLLHFDMHHGYNNLKKAIDKLDQKNKKDFETFVNEQNTFNPHIMFIARPTVINQWFEDLFDWLYRCEEVFDFEKLDGYDTGRLFAYLSERYLSYWFKKNCKYKEKNWVQLDNF